MFAHINGSPRLPLIDEIEEYLYDARLRWTMPGTRDMRVVIVDIDERSIAAEGHFPWQRDKLARLVDSLFDHYQAKVVAFDMVFAEPEESTALQLLDELEKTPGANLGDVSLDELRERWQTDRQFAESIIARDVVLGFAFKPAVREGEAPTSGALPPPSIRAEQLADTELPLYEAVGFVGNFEDLQATGEFGAFFSYPRRDEVIRQTPLLQFYRRDVYETLGLAAARLYLGNPPIRLEFDSEDSFSGMNLESLLLGERRIPVDQRTQVFIPFRGQPGSFPYVSATDVLNHRADAELLRNSLVLVGTTSAGLLDLRATPVADAYPGIEVHANLASGILDQRFMYSPSYIDAVELVAILVNLFVMALLIPVLSPALVALTVLLLLGANVALNVHLWTVEQIIMPIAATLIALLSMAFLQITLDYILESRRKQRLGRMFGQYIPAKLVEEIDTSGGELSLEGENRDMTVLFSDVRGFTSISERLEPTELTRLMNEFLTPITRIIHENRGTIDKYMGDAVMAFWGAPLKDDRHAENAVNTALAIVDAMQEVSRDFNARGWPELRIGIGISTGAMNVGNMGSEFRMAYTVMGDVVNLGSRLEGQTKSYGTDIILSEETAARLSGYCLRELDLIRVTGKTIPIKIFEPIGRTAELSTGLEDEIDLYHRALQLYRKQDFTRARGLFLKLQQSNACPLYELYIKRINAFLVNPPRENWDGVFTATSK